MKTPKDNLVSGLVLEALPNAEFKIELEDKKIIHGYLGGRMKLNRIRVLVGDKVQLELNPYEGKSRIVKRL
jgi:translation initiation factor IF-1